MPRWLNLWLAALVAACAAALTVPSAAPALLRDAPPEPFTVSLQALLGPERTDLYLTVEAVDDATVPAELGLVQVKVFSSDGQNHVRTETFHDVPLPEGEAHVELEGLERAQTLEVKAHAKDGDQNNIEARTKVALRPDLTVRRASVPARVVRKQSFAFEAEIAELAGDTDVEATVTLAEGGATLATRTVTVDGGANAVVSFPLSYPDAGAHSFSVSVSEAKPAEVDTTNNGATATTNVAMYSADGAVASDEANTTTVGENILRAGGNAIDAAVAMQFALNVTQQQNVGIGGGATILVHLANGGGDFAIDARETAPAAMTSTDLQGVTRADSSGIAVGVPGALRAADVMLQRWGTMSLSDTLEPAIRLAEEGFEFNEAIARSTENGRRCQNIGQPELRTLYCPSGGRQRGYRLVQPDLARTFRLIAENGPSVFYTGEIANAIVQAQTRRSGSPLGGGKPGKMTLADLAGYDVVIEAPVFAHYRGYHVVTTAGSSSGGLMVLQALKMLRRFPLGEYGHNSGPALHLMTEAMRISFRDRGFWMGGGPVPVDGLLNDEYNDLRGSIIRSDTRIPTGSISRGNPIPYDNGDGSENFEFDEHPDTSHFSVIDKWGNVVSFTSTLTDAYGTGIMVPGYGFMLNDSLSNFNPAPLQSGTNPGMNDAAPGKRAMGNTAPTIVFKSGEPFIVTGSPGGTSIQSVVLNVVSSMIDHGLSLNDAIDAPRMWWSLDQALSNPGVPETSLAHLRALGHTLRPDQGFPNVGAAQSLSVDPNTYSLTAATDRLTPDAAFAVLEPR